MKDPLVLALDIGTSSVRAILFDARGRETSAALPTAIEAQVAYAQRTTGDGGVEVDADLLLRHTVDCLRQVLRKAGPTRKRIAAVGISCFWHSLLGVDGDGRPMTPVFSWADTRAASRADDLRKIIDPADYHLRTGCEIHPCFWPAKLLWLRETRSADTARVRQWLGFGDYAMLRLFGRATCSLSMASGTGLFDQRKADWDAPTLESLGITPDQLPPIVNVRGESSDLSDTSDLSDLAVFGLTPEFAKTLAPLADLPWFPAIGDGACSNVGSGAVDERRIALNVGTSAAMRVMAPVTGQPSSNSLPACGEGRGEVSEVLIEPGLFCYRVDADTVLFGGAFASGGNVHAWLKQTLNYPDGPRFARDVACVAPDGHGLTVLPLWAGERSPGWHTGARASIAGMNLHTTPADIVRASLEACAYSFDLVRERLQTRFPEATEIVVSGGALAHDPVWTQIMTDVFGVPLVMSKVAEASSRGAALLALRGIGHLKNLGDAPISKGRVYRPDAERHAVYIKGRARYEELYGTLIDATG